MKQKIGIVIVMASCWLMSAAGMEMKDLPSGSGDSPVLGYVAEQFIKEPLEFLQKTIDNGSLSKYGPVVISMMVKAVQDHPTLVADRLPAFLQKMEGLVAERVPTPRDQNASSGSLIQGMTTTQEPASRQQLISRFLTALVTIVQHEAHLKHVAVEKANLELVEQKRQLLRNRIGWAISTFFAVAGGITSIVLGTQCGSQS